MSIRIDDGKGRGYEVAVNSDQQLMVRAISQALFMLRSEQGNLFSWSSTFATGATDIEVISIQNDEATDLLYITDIFISGTGAAVWTLFEVTSGTPAGSTITPVNLNLTSGIARSNTSFGDASVTGSLSGTTLRRVNATANARINMGFGGGLILGNSDKIALTCSANTTVYVNVIGFWKAPD